MAQLLWKTELQFLKKLKTIISALVLNHSAVSGSLTPQTAACQALLSRELSRQEF